MKYKFLFSKQAKNEIKKLDNSTKILLKNWINKHIIDSDNPKSFGKPLSGDKKGLRRYRIGNYRLICIINDNELIVLALTFGHRSEVYK